MEQVSSHLSIESKVVNCQHAFPIVRTVGLVFLVASALRAADVPLGGGSTAGGGSIDGKVAVMVVPAVTDRNGDTRQIDAAGCDVHLIEADEQTTQWRYPCDVWFQPPPGRYLFWLEQGASVSFQSILTYAGEPFTGSGLMLPKTMYPSGYVRLKDGTNLPDDATFRLISLERVESYRPFDRRIAKSASKEEVRVPIGSVIAGVFDGGGQALSLSRPQQVSVGKTTTVNPEKPARGKAAVVGVFSRPLSEGLIPCDVTFVTADLRPLKQTVNFQTQDRIVVAWYDLAAPDTGRLTVMCNDTQPLTRTVQLHSGGIETVRATLVRPPPSVQPVPGLK